MKFKKARQNFFFSFFIIFSSVVFSQECEINSIGNNTSYNRVSWGQSFVPSCSGKLEQLKFKAASTINQPFTFKLLIGNDCSGQVIYIQTIPGIVAGENVLNMNIDVTSETSYYFNIKSNSNSLWKIKYSNTNTVEGNLRTYRYGTYNECDYNFTNFDWNFNVLINENSIPQTDNNIDLYILAGQSNAQGYASQGLNYPYNNQLDSQIKFNWNLINQPNQSDGWINMSKQTGRFIDGYFGPEVTFSRELKKEGDTIGIFKYTRPGSNLYNQWGTPGEGGYFDEMVTDFIIAKNQLLNIRNSP